MSLSAAKRGRLQEIVNELQEIVGGCLHEDGRPMTFAELEEECIEAGDLLTAALLQQRVTQRKTPQVAPCCPTCQREGTPSLDDEARVAVRGDRLTQRRTKAAMFRELKTLDQFNFAFNPSINKQQIYELATCRFIREAKDVLWLGPPGVGKSFLVQALGYQAIKAGFLVYYRSVFDVVRDFMQDEAFGGQDKVLAKYLKPDLLIIDDMGMKQLPAKSGEFLFEIIMRRYELKSTMMTSNRPIEDWGKLIGDVPAASAILDRFLHRAELIRITGKSYRMRDRNEPQPPPSENKKRRGNQNKSQGEQS